MVAPVAVAEDTGLHITRELIDLSQLNIIYKCRNTRTRAQIAAMVGVEQSQISMLSYTTPAIFLNSWGRLFSQDKGRTGPLTSSTTVLVIYELGDLDCLSSALLPLLTESGEFRQENGYQLLQERFKNFAVVLAGWSGPGIFLIDRLATDKGIVPPIRLKINSLE
jgi:hypothetical protein